jgi:hypothetical protein
MRIGSFNVGVHQDMLTSKKMHTYMHKVEDIITTCVQDSGLHIMNLCEFGGHLQGLTGTPLRAIPPWEASLQNYSFRLLFRSFSMFSIGFPSISHRF